MHGGGVRGSRAVSSGPAARRALSRRRSPRPCPCSDLDIAIAGKVTWDFLDQGSQRRLKSLGFPVGAPVPLVRRRSWPTTIGHP